MEFATVNWPAVAVGAIAAYGLGMIWFSPLAFGRGWAAGSHGIRPPATPPVAAMTVQLLGTIAMALVIGLTETRDMLITAIAAILAAALLVAGMDLFSQKTGRATLIDAGYVVAAGALMILAQGQF
jgi:hypothetical protein